MDGQVMRIAVITPYYKESDAILAQCHQSVLDQTAACDHILVADGFPKRSVTGWPVKHYVLPSAHGDGGNLARIIGSISAFNLDYDAVAFLDADNWYQPDHISRLVALQARTGAAVCTSNRSMHRLDGSYMFDDDKNDGRSHVDTSCFFFTRAALPVIAHWAQIPKELAAALDTVYWSSIRSSRLRCAHEPHPTVCYRTPYESDYRRMGEAMPEGGKNLALTDQPFRWFKSLLAEDRWRIWREFGWPLRQRTVAKIHAAYALSWLRPFSRRQTAA